MKCPKCYENNADTNRFCYSCGTRLQQIKQSRALQLAYNNTSVIGEARHKNNFIIIDSYQNSDDPLDILAVAFSYEREGASYRRQAISYFERFLSNPAPIPLVINHTNYDGKQLPLFSNWCIYSTIATLYEKEYDFENALKYLKLLPKESNFKNPSDYTRIGDVLEKIDINQAVSYYQDLIKQPIYKIHKRNIDIAFSKAKEKQQKGYQFKPRKKRI